MDYVGILLNDLPVFIQKTETGYIDVATKELYNESDFKFLEHVRIVPYNTEVKN